MRDAFLFAKFKESNNEAWFAFLDYIQEIGCMHIHFSAASAHRSIIHDGSGRFFLRDIGEDDFHTDSEKRSAIQTMDMVTFLSGNAIIDAYTKIPQPEAED